MARALQSGARKDRPKLACFTIDRTITILGKLEQDVELTVRVRSRREAPASQCEVGCGWAGAYLAYPLPTARPGEHGATSGLSTLPGKVHCVPSLLSSARSVRRLRIKYVAKGRKLRCGASLFRSEWKLKWLNQRFA
jgi:hypothetical protein